MSTVGRPRKILDEQEIRRLIGKGFTVEWVADYLDVAPSTLYENYSNALRKGRMWRDGCLQAKMYHTAMAKNNVTMQIWLSKQWLKMSEKVEVDEKKPPMSLGFDEPASDQPSRVC